MSDVNINVPNVVKGYLLFVAAMFGFVAGVMAGVMLVVLGS